MENTAQIVRCRCFPAKEKTHGEPYEPKDYVMSFRRCESDSPGTGTRGHVRT